MLRVSQYVFFQVMTGDTFIRLFCICRTEVRSCVHTWQEVITEIKLLECMINQVLGKAENVLVLFYFHLYTEYRSLQEKREVVFFLQNLHMIND